MTHPFAFSSAESDNSPTAAKVAEVFLTAGHAFQKLGDLALKLNQPISENTNETKWSEKDVDRLKESLTRFANDLDNISESVQGRIVQKIKTDIKRKTLIGGGLADSRAPLSTSSATSYTNANANTSQTTTVGTAANRPTSGYGNYGTGGNYGGMGGQATSAASTSLGSAVDSGGLAGPGMHGKDEYNVPPVLNPHGVTRPTQQAGLSTTLKRNASPSGQMYGASGMPMTQRAYMGGGVGREPPYKKPSYGGTTFRPIRTISATVNSSPNGGHSIQLARSGGTPQHRSQFAQQPRQSDQLLGGVLELEDSPPGADKEESGGSISPAAQPQH